MTANFIGFAAGRTTPIIGAASVANNTSVPALTGFYVFATALSNVTLTLQDGSTWAVNPAVGETIYPAAVVKAVVNSGTVSAMYNLK